MVLGNHPIRPGLVGSPRLGSGRAGPLVGTAVDATKRALLRWRRGKGWRGDFFLDEFIEGR